MMLQVAYYPKIPVLGRVHNSNMVYVHLKFNILEYLSREVLNGSHRKSGHSSFSFILHYAF